MSRWKSAESPTMPFKKDDKGQLVTQEVNGQLLPVFVHADGKEAPFDADSALSTIAARNAEAKQHREAKEAAEKALAPFAGIDPDKAKKALKEIENWDEKQRAAAGERDQAIAQAVKARDDHFAPVVAERDALVGQLNSHLIGSVFSGSQFVAEKINAENAAAAAQIARALFEKNFKVENGKVVAYDGEGKPLYSRTRPGELADSEEALQLIVESSPLKASILKGTGAAGSGAGGGNGGGGGQAKVGPAPKRADFADDISYQRAAARHSADSAAQ